MKCGDCINYGTCRHTCNVVRISDICSSFLGKLSCDGCKYDSDRFSDICYHDCIMFSDYQKEDISIPKEKPMSKVIFESEEEARAFCKDCGFDADFFGDRIKEKGYIRKSVVEEAEELFQNKHQHDQAWVMSKMNDAIQYLKAENERSKR